MTTISPHTTRAAGTILTAAIYNFDHTNHVTNAEALDDAKLEAVTPPVVDGELPVFDGISGRLLRSSGVHTSDLYTGRVKISANRTYYVRTDGNDLNDGLTNNSTGAFLTLQAAYNRALTLDCDGFTVTIKLGQTATYTNGLSVSRMPQNIQELILEGDVTTPSNTVIATSGANAVTVGAGCRLTVRSVRLQTATSGNAAEATGEGAELTLGSGMQYNGAQGSNIAASSGGRVRITGNYTILGTQQRHLFAITKGLIEYAIGTVVTLTSTPGFSVAFAESIVAACIKADSVTYSGAATGQRYRVNIHSVIYVGGGGANYFPGNTAGQVGTAPPDYSTYL